MFNIFVWTLLRRSFTEDAVVRVVLWWGLCSLYFGATFLFLKTIEYVLREPENGSHPSFH